MPDVEIVCRHCGHADTVSETVEVSGWRAVNELRVNPDGLTDQKGRPALEYSKGRAENDGDYSGTGFHCSNCGSETGGELYDLVEVREIPRWECRTCHWSGNSTDNHPASCPEEPEPLDPPAPIPGQESLL